VDLLNNMGMLDSEKKSPRYLVPSDELGSIPLGALGVRDEVSVATRLESLEGSMRKVCSVLEQVKANPPVAVTSRLDGLEEMVRRGLGHGLASPSAPSFASVAGTLSRSVPEIVVTPGQQPDGQAGTGHGDAIQRGGQDGAGALGTGVGAGVRPRTRSPSLKRKADEANADEDGWRKPGRQRQRKTAAGTSQIQIEDVGEYIAPAEFYIGNTDSRTNEETIKTVIVRCAAAVEGGAGLVVEKVELLTKEDNPRTKCWKIVVPHRFKSIIEKNEVYPAGWKRRTFFGSRTKQDKKPRIEQEISVEQQVLTEQHINAEQLQQEEKRQAEKQRLELLESRMKNPTLGQSNTA
jgi:hypothetical protein